MDPKFEKAAEIYFRLGIIYKYESKFDKSLECFKYILKQPPEPLTEHDVMFQIGHLYEFQKRYEEAKEIYDTILKENPSHSKVLQQLGWIHYLKSSPFHNPQIASKLLQKAIDIGIKFNRSK